MWPNSQESANLVTFTEEILNGNLHFLCSDVSDIVFNIIIRAVFRVCQTSKIERFTKSLIISQNDPS